MRPFKVAKDMLDIYTDITDIKGRSPSDDYEIHMFDQTWASTALGFGGCGGSAWTTRPTYVLIPDRCRDRAFVYFDGIFAYSCSVNDAFRKDVEDHNMASVQVAATRYKS